MVQFDQIKCRHLYYDYFHRKEEHIKQQQQATRSPSHQKRSKKGGGGLMKGSLLRAQQKLSSSRSNLLGSRPLDESSSSACITPDLLDSSPDAPPSLHAKKKPLYTEIGSNNIPLSTTTRPSSLFGSSRNTKSTSTNANNNNNNVGKGPAVVSTGTTTTSSKFKETPPVEKSRQRRYHRHQKAKSLGGGSVLPPSGARRTSITYLSSASENCSSPSMIRRVSW